MCVIANAKAGELKINRATISADAPSYGTMEEAAEAAMQSLRSYSEPWEYGGIIVKQDDGRYQVSSPVTDRNDRGVSYAIPKELRKKLVATYHSHPWVAGGAHSDRLSKDDKAVLKQLGVPMYVLDKRSGKTIFAELVSGTTGSAASAGEAQVAAEATAAGMEADLEAAASVEAVNAVDLISPGT